MPPSPGRAPAPVGLLRLAAPLVASFTARAAFSWVDLVYASWLEGEPGLAEASIAAIGLVLPLEYAMIACWVGTSNGLTSRLATAMGARQGERIEQLQRVAHKLVLALGLAFTGLGALLYLRADALGLEPLLTRQLAIYGGAIAGLGAFVFFGAVPSESALKAHHDTRSTMWASFLAGFVNLGLNTLFVFAFGWGLAGIAISTVLARAAGLVFTVTRAGAHERARLARAQDTEPGRVKRPLIDLLAFSVPATLAFLLLAVESFAINGLLTRTESSTAALAAWSLFDRAVRLAGMPLIACSVALLPLVARLNGAGDRSRIRREVGTLFLASIAWCLVLTLLELLGAGRALAGWLIEEQPARAYASLGMRFVPAAVLGLAPLLALRGTFEGLQLPNPALFAGALRTLLFVVPLTALGLALAPRMEWTPLAGACAGFTTGAALSGLLMAVWLQRALPR